MTDRELLEKAAKAAGIENHTWEDGPFYSGLVRHNFDETGMELALQLWNPLTDDGDALRLAVKLHLFDSSRLFEIRLQEIRADPVRDDDEIMRRAIVRAAAAIGEQS